VHPTQPVEIFDTFSMPFGTLAIQWNPPSEGGGVNARGVTKYSNNFGPIEGYISETVQDRR